MKNVYKACGLSALKYIGILMVAAISCHAQSSVEEKRSNGFGVNDIFQSLYFIKNTPGLIEDYHGKHVRYYADNGGVSVFLTDQGPIYKLTAVDRKKTAKMEQERKSEGEHGGERADEHKPVPLQVSYTFAEWVGANPHPRIEEVSANAGYYSYLAGKTDKDLHTIVTNGCKKLIYHDLYPGIDVAYSMPDTGGMKYDLIVHPGADLSRVRIQYKGSTTGISADATGNITVSTPAGDFMEHAPLSYYSSTHRAVECHYKITGLGVSFELTGSYDAHDTLIVDPWVTTITQMTGRNLGTIVDYDRDGNLIVYGASAGSCYDVSDLVKVAKYDASGNFQWVFSGAVPSAGWITTSNNGYFNLPSGIKVDKSTGKIYVGKAFDYYNGVQMVRITGGGLYDNFISTISPDLNEIWSIGMQCNSGKVLAVAGGTSASNNLGLIDPVNGGVSHLNFTGITSGNYQDVVCATYDGAGNLYALMASTGVLSLNNNLFRLNAPMNGYSWRVQTGYSTMSEDENLPAYSAWYSANNFNALAANNSYLYYYDGAHLAAYNLNTGNMVGSPLLPNGGNDALVCGGIAVDECNHIYIGAIGAIKTYTFNGVNFTAGASISLGPPHSDDTVLDVRYEPGRNLLYATGSRLAGTYTAALSVGCSSTSYFSATVRSGCDTAIVRVSPASFLISPTFSYVWRNGAGNVVRSTLPGAQLADTVSGLSGGQYTVEVVYDRNCVEASRVLSFRPVCNHTPDTAICVGQSARLWYSGSPGGGQYLWQPGLLTDSVIVVAPSVSTMYYITYIPPSGPAVTDSIYVAVGNPSTTHLSGRICASGSYYFGGHYLTHPGTYHDTLSGFGGCDSVLILQLDTGSLSVGYLSRHICFGSTFSFGQIQLSQPGIYRDTIVVPGGCDSITVLTLMIDTGPSRIDSGQICQGGYGYYYNGFYYYYTGTYSIFVHNPGGCDSVISLVITMTAGLSKTVSDSYCLGSYYNGYYGTFYAPGTYTVYRYGGYGCDTAITLHLTIDSSSGPHKNDTINICASSYYYLYGQYFYRPGTYRVYRYNPVGCDSIISLTLHIDSSGPRALDTVTVCAGNNYYDYYQGYLSPGTHTIFRYNPGGCDSIISLTVLSTNYQPRANDTAHFCLGAYYYYEGSYFSQPGTYIVNVSNAVGCDSIITLVLCQDTGPRHSVSASFCAGTYYSYGYNSFASAGTYTLYRYNPYGCDSLITLTLIVDSSGPRGVDTATFCAGSYYYLNGHSYYYPGTYTVYRHNPHGCDSTIALTLISTTVHPAGNFTAHFCAGSHFSYQWQNFYYPGTYTVFASNPNGCDSIITLVLYVDSGPRRAVSGSFCAGRSYYSPYGYYSQPGTYTAYRHNPYGCDSIITLTLSVDSSGPHGVDTMHFCAGSYYYNVNGNYFYYPGTYTVYRYNAYGCDSVIALTLILDTEGPRGLDSVHICYGHSYYVGGNYYNVPGTYQVTTPNYHGCDSLITLVLMVDTGPAGIDTLHLCTYKYIWISGTNISAPGNYQTFRYNPHGCDSVIALTIIIDTSIPRASDTIHMCPGGLAYYGGHYFYSPGVYYISEYVGYYHCDSLITMTVIADTAHPAGVDTVHICRGTYYYADGRYLDSAGSYQVFRPQTNGCDSLITLTLIIDTVNPTGTEIASICLGHHYYRTWYLADSPGTYLLYKNNGYGCDSLITLTLHVDSGPIRRDSAHFCLGREYYYMGSYYNQPGVYVHNKYNPAGGCDSAIILTLSADTGPVRRYSASICYGQYYYDNYFWYGVSQPGAHNIWKYNPYGCDSLIILTLSVDTGPVRDVSARVCYGQHFYYGSGSYYYPGKYSLLIPNPSGCDSLIRITLVVDSGPVGWDTLGICPGGYYIDTLSNNYYYPPATVTAVRHHTGGCDSVISLYLYVDSARQPHGRDTIHFCYSSYAYYYGNYLNTPGTYHIAVPDPMGCDSDITLTAIQDAGPVAHRSGVTCLNHAYYYSGYGFYGPGIDTFPVYNPQGCDSMIILTVRIDSGGPAGRDTVHMCRGSYYQESGTYYTLPGTYPVRRSSPYGCDSIIALTIIADTTAPAGFDTAHICLGTYFTANDNHYYNTGTYHITRHNPYGCDSLIALTLIVDSGPVVSESAHICLGHYYYAMGRYYRTAGTYHITQLNPHGCDSIITLTLYVDSGPRGVDTAHICRGSAYATSGQNLYIAGVYTITKYNPYGCDSIITLYLRVDTVNPVGSDTVHICAGHAYYTNGQYLISSGTYHISTYNANGCDSVITLTLYVDSGPRGVDTAHICFGHPYYTYGGSYRSPGTYRIFVNNPYGCDSIVDLTLFVDTGPRGVDTVHICQGSSYYVNGQWFNSPGNYSVSVYNPLGCDSLISLHVIVDTRGPSGWDTVHICQGRYYYANGQYLYSAGTYQVTSYNPYGCDSNITLTLYIDTNPTGRDTVHICNGSYIYINGMMVSTPGDYQATAYNPNGCDSNLTITVIVDTAGPVRTMSDLICQGSTYYFYNYWYNNAGTYTIYVPNPNGCDSVINLTLSYDTIAQTRAVSATFCQGSYYYYGNYSYYYAGSYTLSVYNPHGCDSTIYLTLAYDTIQGPSIYDTATICSGSPYYWMGGYYSYSGQFSIYRYNPYGCGDSVYTLYLTVNNTYNWSFPYTICQGDSFNFMGRMLTAAGSYTDTSQTMYGCDSIVTLTLTVYPLPAKPTITRSGTTLISSSAASYQWYRNGQPIAGETAGSITVTQNGSYAVMIFDNYGCSQTSDTVMFAHLSIYDVMADEAISIYPNPNTGSFTLQTSALAGKAGYSIYDILGRLIAQKNIDSNREMVDLGVASGVYSLVVQSGNYRRVLRVVVE